MNDVIMETVIVDEITEETSENFIYITDSYGIEFVNTIDNMDIYAIWTAEDGWLPEDIIEVTTGKDIEEVVAFASNLPY